MTVLVLGAGNSIIKAKIARREQGEIAVPLALRQLSESEYQQIITRVRTNSYAKDYIKVNGTPYVAESAERHGLVAKRLGEPGTPEIITVFWLQLLKHSNPV